MWALKGICICWVLSGVFPRESEEGVCLCWFLKCMCSECCVCLCVFGVLSAVCVCVCAGSEGCGRSSGLWRRVCVLGSVGCLVCDGFEGCRVPVLNLMIVYQLNSEGSPPTLGLRGVYLCWVLRDAKRGTMPRKVKGLGLRAWLKDSGRSSCRRLGGG